MTDAETKNEKTKIIMFKEEDNNLSNVMTNICVTASPADRMLASMISLFNGKAFKPLTTAELKEIDDAIADEDSEHRAQAQEIKAYAIDIEEVLTKPANDGGESKFDKYSLSAGTQANAKRYTKAIAIVADQYKKVPENARPKIGREDPKSKTFKQLSRAEKVQLFIQAYNEASPYLYSEIIKRTERSLHDTLPTNGWSALLDMESLRKPAKLQQITKILSSIMSTDGNNALGDARILRTLFIEANQTVPELENISALDFFKIFAADAILRNTLKRDPDLTGHILDFYNLSIDDIDYENMAKKISKFEKTRTYLDVSKEATAYFAGRAPREQRGQREQSEKRRDNKKPRMHRDDFLQMLENYKNCLEAQSKLKPPPTMAEAHDAANNAKGSIVACGMKPVPFHKYKKSRNFEYQWSQKLKNFAWSKGEDRKNDNQSYDELKKRLDDMTVQHANLTTSLENNGIIERDGDGEEN